MSDYGFVLPRIAVGAAIQPADLATLQAVGISHIADATTHDDSVFATAALGFDVCFADENDDGNNQEASGWYQKLAPWFIGSWFAAPGARFLFHCDAGVNRGPSACYLALRLLGFTPDAAANAITAARPQASHPPRYASDADAVVIQLGFAV